jgi:amidase
MTILTKDNAIFTMSPEHSPAASVEDGATVRFETLDCFSCQLTREDQLLGGMDWSTINPATGPLYVENAEPGDVLKVEILGIELDDHGVIAETVDAGVFGAELRDEATKIVPVRDGMAVFNEKLSFPICPMIGVIGTAPEAGAIPNGTPGSHGGNMDCKRIGAGTTLYLPVNVPGALLAMGDMHAIMGDGEVCVCGVEIAGAITVKVTVVKNCALPTPFLVTAEDFMSIFAAATTDEAAKGAALRMRGFLIESLGLGEHEAGMLLSAAGDLRICQIVDPMITCRMELSRYVTSQYGYMFP